MKNFSWSTKKIKRIISISSDNIPVGNLFLYPDKLSAEAELFNKIYRFESRGHLSRYTDVYNQNSENINATIKSNIWNSGAQIIYNESEYSFRFDNIWCKSWKLTSSDGKLLFDYERIKNGGKIESSEENNLPLLCGLYFANKNYEETSTTSLVLFILLMFSIIF